ncbi:hypothetical protein M0R45_004248 [Rubus argutus]|uniref:Uncharacterized protein n=1 Tax=Rubus argutus TaxID=59490 RepID=A0AAW1YJA9_RUBAR
MALRMFAQVPVMSPFSSSTNSGSGSGSVRLQPPRRVGPSFSFSTTLDRGEEEKAIITPPPDLIKAVEESQANSETGSESVSTELGRESTRRVGGGNQEGYGGEEEGGGGERGIV